MGRPHRFGPSLGAGLSGLALLAGACSRTEPTAHLVPSAVPVGSIRSATSSISPSAAASGSDTSAPSPHAAPSRTTAEPTANVVEAKSTATLPGVTLGELFDVGPAGPMAASSDGVVLLTKDDRVLLARKTAAGRADKLKIATLDAPQAAFFPVGRGPSVAGGRAYWISHGRLVRRALGDEHELEVLNAAARDGSRTAAGEVRGTVAVAFLGRPDREGTSHARLWLEGKEPLDLTPEGAGASSVALTRVGDHLLATTLDGRSAMTPMHARTVRVEPNGATLGDDVVVWVGGPAQAWTETFVGAEGERAWAHVPIERDATHFGLASVELGAEPHLDAAVAFFDYANGIDLAPVATAELCGRAYVAFVRPTASAPHSPEELVLTRQGENEAVTLANARGFAAVSLAPVPGGALLAYVADGRTWARGIGCK
ncbi:MAG TPA: hypothetical protein VLJ38_10380 [Polyangiaceae bacterium]|nr:hypothetical protein [Polyangiaceae bacterium]